VPFCGNFLFAAIQALTRQFHFFATHSRRRQFYGFIDFDVAGTTAEIAGQRFLDLITRRLWFLIHQFLCRQEKAGRAIAALRRAEIGEGILQRMKRPARGHAFDRCDLTVFGIQTQKQTRQNRTPVDQDGARAALSQLTSVLGARQRKVFAQDFKQRLVRRKGHFGHFTVECERDVLFLFHLLAPLRLEGDHNFRGVSPTVREGSEIKVGEAFAVAADVRNPEEVEQALAATVERFGRIDIVVNGAAGNFLCAAEELSPNGFGTVVDIDLKGTFNVCRAAFAELKKNQGQILNISATLHYLGTPMQIHVSAAKAGVDALTKNLAVEWGRYGIRVNAIAPGPIGDTEGMKRLVPEPIKEKLKQRIPLGRFGLIEDIENAAVFLCSNAASYINGAVIVVDGGHWLASNSLL
jgi:2,4-dienoyl-CoA reductase [(3E)-enoyl-CoA-producing], peroxisomal